MQISQFIKDLAVIMMSSAWHKLRQMMQISQFIKDLAVILMCSAYN